MKKVLMFCICGIFTIGAAETYVWAATTPSAGSPCTQNGYDLVDRGSEPADCNTVGLYNARRCTAYCNNGTLIFGIETCLAGYYQLYKHEKISLLLYKQCVDLKTACLSSESRATGARWHDGDGKCDCGGQDFEWSPKEIKCVQSTYKSKCDNDSDAYWDDTYGCVCKDKLHKYWDYAYNECKLLPNEAECNEWQSHMTGSNKSQVNWNIATSKCECKKDADGNDITKSDDYYVNNAYRCVKKPYVLRREEVESNKSAANAKQGEIYAIIDDLKKLSDDMGKSHWKNASGGFNTARLASDSIAGVVLGTVGGVITSNVIKKNQVKGGFEDINCTVGGQRVAGYADEFNVGIQ